MKTIKLFLTASLILTTSSFLLAQEMSFTMEVSSEKTKEPIVMKVLAKGSKLAIQPQNIGQGKMSVIMDNTAGKQYMLMDMNGQKMAMVINQETVQAAAKGKDPKLTVTNEKKVIDGYKCTKVIAETDESVSDMWLSEEVGFTYADLFKMLNSSKGPGNQGGSNIPEMKNIKGFPLEMITKDKKKGDSTTLRIKDIVKGNVPDNAFSMEGYKMMDMGNKNH